MVSFLTLTRQFGVQYLFQHDPKRNTGQIRKKSVETAVGKNWDEKKKNWFAETRERRGAMVGEDDDKKETIQINEQKH